MRSDEENIDEDVRALAAVLVRALAYVCRWLVKRYQLDELRKGNSWPL